MPDNVASIQFIRDLDYETGCLIYFTFNRKQLVDFAEGGTDYTNIPSNFLRRRLTLHLIQVDTYQLVVNCYLLLLAFTHTHILGAFKTNKLASLEATLVRNSAHSLSYSLTGVKCRATSVAKN